MALFAISDLHLSFGASKPMDVFGGAWVDHAEKLKEYWIYMVRDEDTVVIPGDISWGIDLNEARPDFEFIESLPGKKIISKGNHDYYWGTVTKMNKAMTDWNLKTITFLNNNAYEVEDKIICGSRGWITEKGLSLADKKILAREALRFRMSLDNAVELQNKAKLEGRNPEIILFSHYPLVTPLCPESEIFDVVCEYDVRRCYYGHLHGIYDEKKLITQKRGIELTLISGDYVSFTPIRII